MSEELVIDLTRNAVLVVIITSAPLLLIALVVGLLISIFQTITSIQEQTLSFVPKIIAVFFGVYLFGPWMMNRFISLFVDICNNFSSYIFN